MVTVSMFQNISDLPTADIMTWADGLILGIVFIYLRTEEDRLCIYKYLSKCLLYYYGASKTINLSM